MKYLLLFSFLLPSIILLKAQNVGIGTATPLAQLHVKSTHSNPVIIDGGNQLWVTLAENGKNIGYLGSFAGEPDDVELGTNSGNITGGVILSTYNIPRLTVANNGNVGIGLSPTYKLHIGNSNHGLRIEGPTNQGSGGSVLNIGGAGDIIVDAPGIVGGRFVIKENGNVGIGTNSPTSKLQVDGAIRVQGRQITHAQGTSLEWNNLEGSGATYLLNNKGLGGGGFVLGEVDNANNITNRLNIDNNGNVGIGKATPASTLDVNGALATKSNYYGAGSGTINLNNSATVWIIATTGYSVSLPDPTACANRRYTIVNKTDITLSISNFYNLGSVVANSIPAFSSIEVISSINTNRWEQIK